MAATALGDRRPTSAGHWLQALTLPAGVRVWWATTAAAEEYEDALLGGVRGGLSAGRARRRSPDRAVVLPFANLRRPTGERKATGLTGSLLPEPVDAATRRRRTSSQLPDGDAEGARGEPPRAEASPAARPSRRARRPPRIATAPRAPRRSPAPASDPDGADRRGRGAHCGPSSTS